MSKQAFEQFVNQYSQQVLNTALRVLRDESLALDVHQEVFLALWQRWDRYHHDQVHWSGYLYRTTLRKALELARSRTGGQGLEASDWATSKVGTPDHALRERELQDQLTRWIADLPARQARIYHLSRHEGLGYAEIARQLGCREVTVRVQLSRALKTLSRKIKKWLE